MANIKFFVDSTVGLPFDWYPEHNIGVVPLSIAFPPGSKYKSSYKGPVSDFDIQPDRFIEFLKPLSKKEQFPLTAAPNVIQFTSAIDKAFNEGAEGVIIINLMGNKSATLENAIKARDSHEEKDKIAVIDSNIVGPSVGYMALDGKKYSESHSFKETVDYVSKARENQKILVIPETLKFLHASGRIRDLDFYVGSILRVIPIISAVEKAEGYDLESISRLRSTDIVRNATIREKIESLVGKWAQDFYAKGLRTADYMIANTGESEKAKALDGLVHKALRENDFRIGHRDKGYLPLVLTTILGPGAFAAAIYGRKN
jgi:DegV family protein with EDD domain